MELIELYARYGEHPDTLPPVNREKFEEVFETFKQLCANEDDDSSLSYYVESAYGVAFRGMTAEFFVRRWNPADLESPMVKKLFAGIFLMAARMNGESLRSLADRLEVTDYLRNETVLGELSIDEWKAV